MKNKTDTIKLKNSYFEELIMIGPNEQNVFSRPFKSLLEKNLFPGEFKPRYWLGRALERIKRELNQYMEAKGKLIKQHTKTYNKDGQTVEKGEVVKKWKRGDLIFFDNGTPDWIDFNLYLKDFKELQEIEIDLGIQRIAFNSEQGPDAVGQEMLLLIPLLKEPKNDSALSEK